MNKKRFSPPDKNISVGTRTTTRGRTEKDIDEQVHSGDVEIEGGSDNEDPDDKVHHLKREKPGQLKAEDHPQDPDDLVHESDDEDDE